MRPQTEVSSMSNYNTIVYEVENGRARITLDRPEKLNALSLELKPNSTKRSGMPTTTRTSTRLFSAGTVAPSVPATT
jgi:hypothetical protein